MITVIYVHGTGIRKGEDEETLQLLEKNFSPFTNLKIESCLWGESFGARLNANGMSIPTYDSTRAIEQYEDEDESVALWELLYVDPLYEIRALSICKKKDTFFHPGKITPDEKLMDQFRRFQYSPSFEAKLNSVGLDEVFDDAFKSVIDSRPLKTAINFNPDIFNENRSIIARAIIAKALKICDDKKNTSRFYLTKFCVMI